MKPQKNALEWIVFAVSALLILGVLAALIHATRDSHHAPPDLIIATGEGVQKNGVFQLPVTITNRGDQTAEDAQVEILLLEGNVEVERAELEVSFVPSGSTRTGFVSFRRNPASFSVVTRVAFNEP
jgi:uncharacterized protein (TIGR02588 family)